MKFSTRIDLIDPRGYSFSSNALNNTKICGRRAQEEVFFERIAEETCVYTNVYLQLCASGEAGSGLVERTARNRYPIHALLLHSARESYQVIKDLTRPMVLALLPEAVSCEAIHTPCCEWKQQLS